MTTRRMTASAPDLAALHEVLSHHPRERFTQDMFDAYFAEIAAHPDGAFAVLERTITLSERFLANPMNDLSG